MPPLWPCSEDLRKTYSPNLAEEVFSEVRGSKLRRFKPIKAIGPGQSELRLYGVLGNSLPEEVAAALPEGVLKVGVFVNEEPGEVLRTAREVGLDFGQLHGDEGPEAVAEVRAGGVGVMKALRVRDADTLEEMGRYEADLFLLDAYSEKARGGTGERFDWGLAKSLKGHDNIVISGGLTPENVREAVGLFGPFGVDASSSLEDAPGKKNRERVRRFVLAAKG
jgi:phosphoribosylanthranilate isomerase